MPPKAKKPCNFIGCIELTTERYCEKHRRDEAKRVDQIRGTSTQRGYDSRWRKARASFLKRNPLCIECGRLASVVDHRTPHKGNYELFWDVSNWGSMCKPCHDRKTAREDGRWG
jgi:5-methylcytosine-specific restriction protein A